MAETTTPHGWIDLLSADGPFLSPVALDPSTVGARWPTRLDAGQRELLLQPSPDLIIGDVAIEVEGTRTTDASERDRVEQLLTELLGYRPGKTLAVQPALTATHHIYRATVAADFVVHAQDDPSDVRMVVMCDSNGAPTNAHRTSNFNGWVSTPVQRAALLARHAGADLALVSDGHEHLLVNVVTGTTGSAQWTLSSLEDKDAQDAFVALLHKERVLHRQTSTSKLIELSQDRQQELTKTLGRQVRRAAEVLVNAISRANRTTRGELLEGVDGPEVYSAATRVLMRTVFLLLAEERGLLPVAENQLYAREYAVSTLLDQLEEDEYRNRSAMQRRSGAWQRLLALSRALHSGVDHDSLRLAAYGGDLFDPATHPFLEGITHAEKQGGQSTAALDVGVVDDYTVLTVLRHLQVADGQRISFRSLDVEQVGHVYESLLDHSAVLVRQSDVAVLGLVGRSGDEPEVSIAQLEEWASEGTQHLHDELARRGVAADAAAVENLLDTTVDPEGEVARTISIAVGNDDGLRSAVAPYLPLLRTDARGVALVFLPGDVYVTETSSKRDSGTAYTPRSLADEVAKHTLDPLIYEPGPHNEPDEAKWRLRPPAELLGLKVCDPAVGSAAILVAAARYLAEALLQARIEVGDLPEDALDTAAVDQESLDVRVEARRDVVSSCIYGVDRDPMAVEMAKLSLWLVTMARERPFTFLDHSIRCGDSLLGITSLEQLRKLHLEPAEVARAGQGMAVQLGGEGWWERIEDSIAELRHLRDQIRGIDDDRIEDIQRKSELHARSTAVTGDQSLIADAICAIYMSHSAQSGSERTAALAGLGPKVVKFDTEREGLVGDVQRRLEGDNPHHSIPRRPLHWPLVFPEVFIEGGKFDAIVANPPFIKSQGLRESVGSNYRDFCSTYLARGRKGKADFIAYFAWRISDLSHIAGFLATNSIAQGDTLRVGLEPLSEVVTIYRAVRMTTWPGGAGVNISKIWISDSDWNGSRVLENKEVASITPALEAASGLQGPPLKLKANANKAFQGFQVIADGFELDVGEAEELARMDPGSAAVIRPFVNGDHINGPSPRCSSNRRIIDFGTMSLAKARTFDAAFSHVEGSAKPEILAKAAPKPNGKASSYARWADSWWQFWSPRPALRKATKGLDRVLAMARTSKVFYPVFVPADWCLTDALVVFAYSDYHHFGVLTSSFHWWWAIAPPGTGGSTLETRPRYTPTTSFQTFPQPLPRPSLEQAGQSLHDWREKWMDDEGIGLLKAYNKFHSRSASAAELDEFRSLHRKLDEAVLEAYAECDPHHPWTDLSLDHDYYDCGFLGERYTVSPSARVTALNWLLDLNFRRYAEEKRISYEQVLRETGND